MDPFRISSNETLFPESSTPWNPFHGPLASIEPWNFKLLAALMFLVTVLSASENFIVILVTFKFKQLRQPLNYIIVNLAVADFLVSVIGSSISFVTNSKGYFYLGAWACVLEGFAVTFFGIVALWSLAILAFERYVVICRPLGNIRLRGKHSALGIAFVWVFSFIWTVPPTMGWSSYTTSKIGTTCEPNWYSGNYEDRSYIITFFTTCFILPLLVIFLSYGKLMQKLRKVSDTQGRLGSTRKPEKEVTRMILIMILAFLICWSPYATFSILVTACPAIDLEPRLAAIPAFFAKTASAYNPIIYVFMNKQFRRCLLQMFQCGDKEAVEFNVNQVTERVILNKNSHGDEMFTIEAHVATSATSTTPQTEAEKSSCNSFAQLSNNNICPV
ncbi:vertebrate ancient opsin [Microcaecilia unicolor]|uniref:Vertebrate ancient opsin-like n=1 Tax=Microcaecilia unicolor TaxID=1415580 RepID=A0A6P7YC96_9AMPH|nr:vertebrate ancient opsin-like [Microcaecilia unicolor]